MTSLFKHSEYKITNRFRQVAFGLTIIGAISISLYPKFGVVCFCLGGTLCFIGTTIEKISNWRKVSE